MLWLLPLKRYFQFSGRSGRAEFWQFTAMYIVLIAVCAALDDSVSSPYHPNSSTLTTIAVVALAIPFYAAAFRRLHDSGASGWVIAAQWATGFVGGFFGAIHNRLSGSIIGVPFLLIEYAGYLASFAVSVYTIRHLCLPGDPDSNRFGPPPHDTAANAPKLHDMMASVTDTARGFAPKPAQPDRLAQLERLSRLRQDRTISEAEFEEQKAFIPVSRRAEP